ncbi:MAG: alpha/beta fold hydrolase [Acidimicrobiales bacterium]|nr:alpha/beta fold hydrolase [Acidimicrobiales bacterium]
MTMSETVMLWFDWHGLTLAGSLHLPSQERPHPVAVMAQGSGPADRDSGGYFGPIRDTFVENGIATFAFDKPGCGESSGDWRDYGLEDRAKQMVSALELVRSHPSIDRKSVGIFGHSQGGWLVQKLASRLDELAFAIASSAPTLRVREQILYDCEHALRIDGHDQRAISDALSLANALQLAAINGEDYESISHDLLTPASQEPWYSSFPTIEGPGDWHHVTQLIAEPHEPVSDLRSVRCPFLAVYGGLDTLLPPWRGAEESGRALEAAESSDVTTAVFPIGDHRMQNSDTQEFVEGYLGLLGHWAADRAR